MEQIDLQSIYDESIRSYMRTEIFYLARTHVVMSVKEGLF